MSPCALASIFNQITIGGGLILAVLGLIILVQLISGRGERLEPKAAV
ncbi:MAG: hypothetical protein HYT42_01450 [Candidatus Sungbacteria bacterium]|nr:hypothetical protein [Candidatus Sungbacteria bacterium]